MSELLKDAAIPLMHTLLITYINIENQLQKHNNQYQIKDRTTEEDQSNSDWQCAQCCCNFSENLPKYSRRSLLSFKIKPDKFCQNPSKKGKVWKYSDNIFKFT